MYNKLLDIPAWSMIKNPFHYKSRESNHLLITVGDSWTYGDSLGKTRVRDGIDDTEYRLEHVYGNLLSKQLDADWMNLALPGGSNYNMLNWLGQLLDRRYNQKVTCVITLTEAGRHQEHRWVDKFDKLQPALEHIVKQTYSMIAELTLRYPKVKFVTAHNFTDSLPGHTLDRTWIEVLTGNELQNDTFIVISDHIKQLNYDKVFPDTPDVIDRALKRIDILDACEYCCKEDSRHPNELGHRQWADYLITQL